MLSPMHARSVGWSHAHARTLGVLVFPHQVLAPCGLPWHAWPRLMMNIRANSRAHAHQAKVRTRTCLSR